MDAVLPWDLLLAPILEHYPKPGNGRRPIGALVMLRIYFMQQWYGLSDPAMEDSLYDVESMRRFAGVDMNGVPDETTICKFRHFLEAHGLTRTLFEQTKRYLSDRGMMVSEGTIVDATIIHAPSSTKNKEGKRDPEMASTKKGNTWHFGMRPTWAAIRRDGCTALRPRPPRSTTQRRWRPVCMAGRRRSTATRPMRTKGEDNGQKRRRPMAGASQGQPRQTP